MENEKETLMDYLKQLNLESNNLIIEKSTKLYNINV